MIEDKKSLMEKLSKGETKIFFRFPQTGEVIRGKVISFGDKSPHQNFGSGGKAIYVDLGLFGIGIIYGKELHETSHLLKKVKAGKEIAAKIIDLKNEEGYIELSLKEAEADLVWEELREQEEKKAILSVKISGANKGGLIANISGIPAFLPLGQLSREHYPQVKGDKAKISEHLKELVGKNLEVSVIDLDSEEEKLIISEKEARFKKLKEIIGSYKKGDVIEGKITAITDFGVFLEFGKGLEGMIHALEISKEANNFQNILKVGEKIKAKIKSIDNNRISLSLA